MSDCRFLETPNVAFPASDLQIFWCIGLYASGSTWLFNAGKKIAAASGLDAGMATFFATNEAELVFPPGTMTAIVKTHEVEPAAAEILMARSQAIWLSLRDPRDCITSLMRYQNCAFEEAVEMTKDAARFCLSVLHHPRTKLFRYESHFFDAPETLDIIASSFGRDLEAADSARIYAETRRSAIESFINTFPQVASVVGQPEPGHFVDLNTQWHTHHVGRDGEIGRWRKMLTTSQITVVNEQLADLMIRLGYQV
jgi:hypothetical protein